MKAYSMRCKHCGSLLDATGGWVGRLLARRQSLLSCAHCGKSCTREDAAAMGYSFGSWTSRLIERLLNHTLRLPVISLRDMAILLRQPHADHLRELANSDALCSYLTHMFRPVLLEQAHGRLAEFDIRGVSGEEEWMPGEKTFGHDMAGDSGSRISGDPAHLQVERGSDLLVAILGQVEDERGQRAWEAIVARVGASQFAVYTPSASEGTVGFAMRQQVGDSRKQTIAKSADESPARATNLVKTG